VRHKPFIDFFLVSANLPNHFFDSSMASISPPVGSKAEGLQLLYFIRCVI